VKTITVEKAAKKIGCTVGDMKGHKYISMHGTASVPERFWNYSALTQEEYDQYLKNNEKPDRPTYLITEIK
jgi:hypothetical protein